MGEAQTNRNKKHFSVGAMIDGVIFGVCLVLSAIVIHNGMDLRSELAVEIERNASRISELELAYESLAEPEETVEQIIVHLNSASESGNKVAELQNNYARLSAVSDLEAFTDNAKAIGVYMQDKSKQVPWFALKDDVLKSRWEFLSTYSFMGDTADVLFACYEAEGEGRLLAYATATYSVSADMFSDVRVVTTLIGEQYLSGVVTNPHVSSDLDDDSEDSVIFMDAGSENYDLVVGMYERLSDDFRAVFEQEGWSVHVDVLVSGSGSIDYDAKCVRMKDDVDIISSDFYRNIGLVLDYLYDGISESDEFDAIYVSERSDFYGVDFPDEITGDDLSASEYFASVFHNICRTGDQYYDTAPESYAYVQNLIDHVGVLLQDDTGGGRG